MQKKLWNKEKKLPKASPNYTENSYLFRND